MISEIRVRLCFPLLAAAAPLTLVGFQEVHSWSDRLSVSFLVKYCCKTKKYQHACVIQGFWAVCTVPPSVHFWMANALNAPIECKGIYCAKSVLIKKNIEINSVVILSPKSFCLSLFDQ